MKNKKYIFLDENMEFSIGVFKFLDEKVDFFCRSIQNLNTHIDKLDHHLDDVQFLLTAASLLMHAD